MENLSLDTFIESIKKLIFDYSPKVIAAILLLVVGLWATGFISKTLKKIMNKRKIETTISNFLGNVVLWILRFMLFVVVISKLGVETSSFVAIIGAAGLAIGLSLQGSLSNFAGGILIILFKPFKVGDFIEAQGVIGSVKEIQIFNTILTSPENKKIVLPNAAVSNGNIINFTTNGTLRNDMIIGVDYGSDLKLVKDTLMQVMDSCDKILKEPAPTVFVLNLNSSSIDFAVRPWSSVDDYWAVRGFVLEETKKAFDNVGIEIPYPHQVEIKKAK